MADRHASGACARKSVRVQLPPLALFYIVCGMRYSVSKYKYMRWSNNLAYLVGLMTTDGNLSKDGRHMSFVSKDLEQVQNVIIILKLKNKICVKNSSFKNNGKYYYVQFGNVEFYKFLNSVGLFPNKTKNLGSLLIPDVYIKDFIRGHLDGDGYTYSYWDKRWKNSFMFYTVLVSASKKHVIWLREIILNLYKLEGKIKRNKSVYVLVFSKKASIKLMEVIYYSRNLICMKRKRFKIRKALGIIAEV